MIRYRLRIHFLDGAKRTLDCSAIGEVRNSESYIVQEAVIIPALDSGSARSLSDAYMKLRLGQLDSLIDFDRIEAVVRERGMIPNFGLDYYFKTSGTGRADTTDSIVESLKWGETIDAYCSPG